MQLQRDDGSFHGGRNGPYNDSETPVRNTAHWLITLLKAFEISAEPAFVDSARRTVHYLLSPSARPMNATFFCRTNPEKDFCNGVIGQAWVIEALAIAGEKLNDPKCIDVARNVFMLHPFDNEAGLWRRVNVDGSYNTFDMTFNHQLWFAAAGSLIEKDSDSPINSRIKRFMERLSESHLNIDPTGRIRHTIAKQAPKASGSGKWIAFIRRNKGSNKTSNQMASKEIGYHAFNMYAFTILRQQMPDLPFWKSFKFLTALNFIDKEEFVSGLENSIYGYPYNPPGFEAAFTIQEFSSGVSFSRSREWWVEQQLRRSYDSKTKMLSRSTEDEKTLTARFYEATRLADMEIQLT
jgi:hypothetical protein